MNTRIMHQSSSAMCPSYINNHLKVKYPSHVFESSHYTVYRINNCLKSTSAAKTYIATVKYERWHTHELSSEKWSTVYPLCFFSSARHNPLHSITNQELFENTTVMKVASVKNMDVKECITVCKCLLCIRVTL